MQKITVNAIIMQKKCKKFHFSLNLWMQPALFFKSMDGLETFVAFQVATSCKKSFFVPHCKKFTVGQGKFYDGKLTAVNSKKA